MVLGRPVFLHIWHCRIPLRSRPFQSSVHLPFSTRKTPNLTPKKRAGRPRKKFVPAHNETQTVPALPDFAHHHRLYPTPRVNVVSPNLCDVTLDLLQNSLEEYKGCDIIDIQPGVGLWSAKIHDLLKPRVHILMEPDIDAFEPYIRPLLERPNSSFKHVTHPIGLLTSYRKVVKEMSDFLAEKYTDQETVPERILVIGSLMSSKTLDGMNSAGRKNMTTIGRQLLKNFISSIADRSLFHTHEPARMLLWVNENDMWPYLPRSLQNPNRAAMGTQLLTDITQIAGSSEQRGERKFGMRSPSIELYSGKQVALRMQHASISLPADRQSQSYRNGRQALLEDNSQQSGETAKPKKPIPHTIAVLKSWLESLNEETILPGFSKKAQARLLKAKAAIVGGEEATPTEQAFSRKRSSWPFWKTTSRDYARFTMNKKKTGQRDDGLTMLGEILRLEEALYSSSSEAGEKKLRKQWMELRLRFDSMRTALATKDKNQFSTDHDEYLGLMRERSSLMWDRRTFEPLVIFSDELFPQQKAALIDIVPKSEVSCTAEEFRRFEDFMIPIRSQANGKLKAAMDNAGHGASELIDQVDLIRNPYKGGRLDPDDLGVKNLTPEMILELSRAWKAWPFRDPTSDRPRHFQLSQQEDP